MESLAAVAKSWSVGDFRARPQVIWYDEMESVAAVAKSWSIGALYILWMKENPQISMNKNEFTVISAGWLKEADELG